MTERERLIELIRFGYGKGRANENVKQVEETIADYLLANGVIVPPCKVGDTVYILAGHNGHKYEKDICEGFYIGNDGVVQVRVRNMKGNHGTNGVMGKTLLLTNDEAEKALKERERE